MLIEMERNQLISKEVLGCGSSGKGQRHVVGAVDPQSHALGLEPVLSVH